MKNVTWTYLGPDGRKSIVDLKHGVKSGNLILFCNLKVLLIDFEVFNDKTYTFFINDELCEVQVHKKEKGFGYRFKIVEDVDTPLNRWKKKMRKKESRMSAIIVSGLLLLLCATVLGFFWYKKYLKFNDLHKNGLITLATFSINEHLYQGKTYNARAVYKFRKATYDIHLKLRKNKKGHYVGKAGLPVETGDEFFIWFSNWHPDNFSLSFYRPTPDQVVRYRQRLLTQFADRDPGIDVQAFHCLFNEVFISKGTAGLAKMYSNLQLPVSFKQGKQPTVLIGEDQCN